MLVPHTFATHFARAVDLFRDPDAKKEQKAEFRALVALLKTESVTLKAAADGLLVNGTAVAGPACVRLVQRLELHNVREIVLQAGPAPGHLFELLRALADLPGADDVPSRLRQAGAQGISVSLAALPVGAETPAPAGAPPPAATPARAPAAVWDDVLAELERDPSAGNVGELLRSLHRRIEVAIKAGREEDALRLIAGIVRCEQGVSAEHRWVYATALKRVYTRPVLEALAQLVIVPGYHDEALLVLERGAHDAIEVLLDLLVASPTVEQRRGLFTALSGMKNGADRLVHLLAHPQWFVASSVAELVGERGLEEAVPALAEQLEHPDERVRKAVALALAKIGTRASAEPLRRALRDESADVRMQVAIGVGGRKSSALAMPLVVALEEEQDDEVERELILALGRIASSAAVQALIRFAQPSGRLFDRKPTALRIAAVEALRLAATPAAVGTLQGLADDSDKQVRQSAREALKDLKR